MKRWFFVLLAAGLIAALAAPAVAADVKFSGQYFAAGYLERNRALTDPQKATQGFYAQRLRVNTTFKIAEGLSLVTRFDALEKVWGSGRSPADTEDRTTTAGSKLAENIEFARAYVDAKMGSGSLRVGYHNTGTTGTAFADSEATAGVIRYYLFSGPWSGYIGFEKQQEKEWSSNYTLTGTNSDADADQWKGQIVYKWSGGDAGLGYTFYNDKSGNTSAPAGLGQDNFYRRQKINPYFRGTFGGLYVEAEVTYQMGDYISYNQAGYKDVSLGGWNWYAKAQYTMGPVYVGGQYAYVQGDDGATTDKYEGGFKSGRDYKPCLIFLNSDLDYWAGSLGTNLTFNGYSSQGAENFTLYQIFAGVKPIKKLDLFASYSIMSLNQKTTYSSIAADGSLTAKTYVDDKIGSEFDITATYKIYDNLAYMIGYGYLWAGDAFKGTSAANVVANDWLLMHKLTLTF